MAKRFEVQRQIAASPAKVFAIMSDPQAPLRSYYEWSEIDEAYAGIFPVIPEAGLRATLGILAREAE